MRYDVITELALQSGTKYLREQLSDVFTLCYSFRMATKRNCTIQLLYMWMARMHQRLLWERQSLL